jgi:DNA polymerase elongation subunit (family B)
MSLKCDKEGNVSKKIEKKGVLLARRDNSNFVRTVYSDIIMKVFDRVDKETILYDTIQHINNLCSHSFSYKDFVITKSVGSIGDSKNFVTTPVPGKKGKVKIGDYVVPLLCEEGKKREQQLTLKNATNELEYYLRCFPAQVQLAEKMRRRGGRVDTGTRLEFMILDQGGPKAKQYEKIESMDYYKDHSTVLSIDFMYYLKALVIPLDQVFACVFKDAKEFTKQQYKFRMNKIKMLIQLKQLFAPKLLFVD